MRKWTRVCDQCGAPEADWQDETHWACSKSACPFGSCDGKLVDDKPFKVLTENGRHPRATIPMTAAIQAYAVYSGKYGRSQSLETIGERGGFARSELDAFIPGWREKFGFREVQNG